MIVALLTNAFNDDRTVKATAHERVTTVSATGHSTMATGVQKRILLMSSYLFLWLCPWKTASKERVVSFNADMNPHSLPYKV